MQVISPITGDVIATYPDHGDEDVERRVAAARAAFLAWRQLSVFDRAEPMRQAAALLRTRAVPLAETMAHEMGKPIADGRKEVAKCAWCCEHYAEHAEAMLAHQHVATDANRSYVSFAPLGVVLAVMPWNFPFWQLFRFAAPALMAGNAALLKHASNVPGCALAIEDVMRDAGFPAGLFATLLVDAPAALRLIDDPRIAAVTLTGSTGAGRAVAARAGAALKKTVLELGGSDAYVILADADLEAAAAVCATSRLLNAGQSCIAAKRFVVVEPVRARFEELLVARMAEYAFGDPLDLATKMGPLARVDLRDLVHRQVTDSVAAGARLLLGGQVPDRPGAWYPPTVLAGVGPGMPAYHEELFGPVAAVIAARDDADAVRIANDSDFGLGAAVFTADRERGAAIADLALEAGSCFVNALVRSDPRLPFGGIKQSGYGRELGEIGIRELCNAKTVWID